MVPASKENSVDVHDLPRSSFGKLSERQSSANPGRRVALAAKPLNTGQSNRNENEVRGNSLKRKPSETGGSIHGLLPKRSRFDGKLTGSYVDKENDDDIDDEPTDDDERLNMSGNLCFDGQINAPLSATFRDSTPVGQRHLERSLARKMAVYPRPKLVDFSNLDLDFPATDKLATIPDNDIDDILSNVEFYRPRFPPPRRIPRFAKEVQRNLCIDLNNFPELSSDDGSDSGEMSDIELHTPLRGRIH